jgi:hypothetical protein
MQDNLSEQSRTSLLLLLLLGFFFVFDVCAIILQALSGEAPNHHGSVVDLFTGSILWMASIIALLTAVMRYPDIKKFMLWLAVCAGAAALAIDEMFEIHEQTLYLFGDDDYIKFAIMLVALTGLIMLYQMEKPAKQVIQLFAVGFFYHCGYLIIDFGDGDFFQLPFSNSTLYLAEEVFEMLAVQTYFSGLLVFYTTQIHTSLAEDTNSLMYEKKQLQIKVNRQPASEAELLSTALQETR